MRTVHLTKLDAEEVRHKLGVLAETDDLLEEYGLTEADVTAAAASAHEGEWAIDERLWPAVSGEMLDHAVVLHSIANDARNGGLPEQASALTRQAKRLELTFKG